MLLKQFRIIHNSKNIEEYRKMGCEQSRQTNTDIISVESNSSQFQLTPSQLICQDRGNIFDLYHFSTMISRSNYSIVRKAINRSSKQERVCKIIPLANKRYLSVVSEIQFLKKLNHPNIVQIIEYFIDSSLIYIILEDIPGGKLLGQLVSNNISLALVQQIFKQLLLAVKYLHNKMIVHRAITPNNIVLYWANQTPFLKLIDFSQASPLDCPNPSKVLVSKRDIPLENNEYKDLTKIDVFDCGMILWGMIGGKRIRIEEVDQYKQNSSDDIDKLGITDEIAKDLKNLLHSMINPSPNKRPSIKQCLDHRFFTHFKKQRQNQDSLKKLIKFPKTSFETNQLFEFFRMYASLAMISSLEKAQLMTEFHNLDTNKDGCIQLEELTQGLQNIFSLSKEAAHLRATQIFNKMDKNHDGTLDYSEYILGTIDLTKFLSEQFIEKMFKELDKNGDGTIVEHELLDMIGDSIIISSKLIGKGSVNYKQFVDIMQSIIKQSPMIQADGVNPKPQASINMIKIEEYSENRSQREGSEEGEKTEKISVLK